MFRSVRNKLLHWACKWWLERILGHLSIHIHPFICPFKEIHTCSSAIIGIAFGPCAHKIAKQNEEWNEFVCVVQANMDARIYLFTLFHFHCIGEQHHEKRINGTKWFIQSALNASVRSFDIIKSVLPTRMCAYFNLNMLYHYQRNEIYIFIYVYRIPLCFSFNRTASPILCGH